MKHPISARTRLHTALAIFVTSLVLTASGATQTVYPVVLTDNLQPGESARPGWMSPDGAWYVYTVEDSSSTPWGIFSQSMSGGNPVMINEGLPPGTFHISGDSSRVVWHGLPESGVPTLWSAPIEGGPAVKLNQAGVGVAQDWIISPNGTHVLYGGYPEDLPPQSGGSLELYSVPIEGGTPEKMHGPLQENTHVVACLQVLPDGSRVVFNASLQGATAKNLYSAPVAGGLAVQLNAPVAPGAYPGDAALSPDSNWVIYRADEEGDGVDDLYRVPAAGGPRVQLNGSLVPGGDISHEVHVSPDSQWVVYVADEVKDDVKELFSVPLMGGPSVRISQNLAPGSNVSAGNGLTPGIVQISPDSSTVVYRVGSAIFSAPIATPDDWVLLNPAAVAVEQYQITPDGQRVVFRAANEVYSVPIRGGSSAPLSGTFAGGEHVDQIRTFWVAPDSKWIVFPGRTLPHYRRELYRAPIAGGPVVKLSKFPEPAGTSTGFGVSNIWYRPLAISPIDGTVVYTARADQDSPQLVYAAKAQCIWDGGDGEWNAATNWNPGIVPDSTFEALIMTPGVVQIAPAGPLPFGSGGGSAESLVLAGVKPRTGPVEEAVVELVRDATDPLGRGTRLNLSKGAHLYPGAVIRGDGIVAMFDNAFHLPDGASVRSTGGEALWISSGPVTNEGSIEAIGTPGLAAEMRFTGPVTNALSTGTITARNATTHIDGGLTNHGSLSIGANARVMTSAASLGSQSVLQIEVSGVAAISLRVEDQLHLDGTLEVSIGNGIVPTAGMVFDLWDAGTITGQFTDLGLPELPARLFWQIANLETTGELRIGTAPDTYEAFEAAHGLTTPPHGDEDGDGLANIFEHLTGRDPRAADAGDPLLTIAGEGVSFTLAPSADPTILVELETSTTLQDDGPGGWTVVASRSGDAPWSATIPFTITPDGNGQESISVDHPEPTDPRRFYRLKATLMP